jgi:hypothetical protein
MPESYEMIPADTKIFSLLIDGLEEALAGVLLPPPVFVLHPV